MGDKRQGMRPSLGNKFRVAVGRRQKEKEGELGNCEPVAT